MYPRIYIPNGLLEIELIYLTLMVLHDILYSLTYKKKLNYQRRMAPRNLDSQSEKLNVYKPNIF